MTMPLPDKDDFPSLAGKLNDYTEVVDPTTDLPSLASNITRANVAGMTRTVDRVYVKWTVPELDNTSANVLDFDSVVGNESSLRPTITKVTIGQWRFTWTPSLTNLMGDEAFWNFREGHAHASHSSPIHLQAKRVSPNVIDVYMWSLPSASATDAVGATLTLWVS